ncbi:MAG: molybdopterin/thiamine biosynthesis adenylyltransferase/rhodanese-related sulfurtransferase [Flavobacteriales bacterium]|jgi:molybdopterin/thiamine biosynthesis adenylyltransferase/rhodanese-related sulfurtransferase
MEFSAQEWLRYTRHIQLPKVGAAGQQKLKNARVLMIGSGGLGSPVSLYLAAAGIGSITLVDHDVVDVTNLQRQIVFNCNDIGKSKSLSAKKHLEALNPHIHINAVESVFNTDIADDLVSQCDLLIDCTDNFATRYLINDSCVKHKKPWIYASIHQFSGQCALFIPGEACYRCLFPSAPIDSADCNSAGVLGVLPGLLGVLQANEAIKFLCELKTPLANTLMLADALELDFRKITLQKNTDCQCCTNISEAASNNGNNLLVETNCVTEDTTLDLNRQQWLSAVKMNDSRVIDVRSGIEHHAFNIGGILLPLDSLEATVELLDKTKVYYIYCQSGIRSAKAVEKMIQSGLNAKSLAGGLARYLKA